MRKASQRNATRARLKAGRYMLLTHGEGYSLDDGTAVRRSTAEQWRTDFFGDQELPTQRRGGPALWPNDDGLFPGHSQTWRVAD